MANLLLITGDNVRAVIDDDDDATDETFTVRDRGHDRRLITVSEEGWTLVGGDLERDDGSFLLASDGSDPCVEFQSGATPSTVAELSSDGRLDLSLGSYGGVRLPTAQPGGPQAGLCWIDTTSNEFVCRVGGSWLRL